MNKNLQIKKIKKINNEYAKQKLKNKKKKQNKKKLHRKNNRINKYVRSTTHN